MKATQSKMVVRALALAVQGALAAMVVMPGLAQAEGDEDVAALVSPTNYVEIGAANVSDKSAKFGEYNGLDKKGGSLIGNVSLKGGDAYGMGTGTTRWSVTGTDLGTTSRNIGATISNQGSWNLGIDFDQLRHNISDSYQTPYQGAMGGNKFTLDPSFGVLDVTRISTSGSSKWSPADIAAYKAGSNSYSAALNAGAGATAMTAGQLAAFHREDVASERKTTAFSFGYNFDRQWGLTFDYKRINQTGAKLISSGTDAGTVAGLLSSDEKVAVLMNPTESTTNNFTLALNWVGDKGYFTGEYYGSLYHDDYSGVSFSNPWVAATGGNNGNGGLGAAANGTNIGVLPVDTMSLPPSNEFHQLNFTGGYAFSSATKLAGGLSYARNTQNESFDGTYTPGTAPVLPVNSLDGLVKTTHADLTLTHQATRDLGLLAGLKYNERDNRTSSNSYTFLNLGGDPQTSVNAPMSNKRTQLDLAANYRIDPRQKLHVGYEYEKFQRWCNNSLANNAQGEAPADKSATPVNTSCAQVPESKENRLDFAYRLRASDAVNVNAGYTYGKRNATVNSSFYNPMQANGEGYEDTGFVAFFQGSRKENLYKAGVNWQANDKLNFGLSGKYADDKYDSTFGVDKGTTGSVNLDAAYSYSDDRIVTAYLTTQRQTRDMTNASGRHVDPIATTSFANNLTDDELTLGIGGKQSNVGKWSFAEDLTYSLGKTDYSTGGQVCAGVTTPTTACGSFPTVKSELTSLKLTGSYKVNKASSVMVGYLYQHLKSNDPTYYNYYSLGYGSSPLPDYQVEPSYNQNVVFAAYKYSFK